MPRVVIATPVSSEQSVLPGCDCRKLSDDIPARTKKIAGALEHRSGIHHVLENVIHRNHVVLSDVVSEVRCLQCAFQHLVSPSPPLGGHLGLDLDSSAFQIEEPTQLV